MRRLSIGVAGRAAACFIAALGLLACHSASTSTADSGGIASKAPTATGATIAGFAFVNSSVTGQGGQAKLPQGTKIYPSGSKVTGTDGCPTTQYHTDGLLVAVIDYQGRQTAGSLAVTRHPATGGNFADAPYYLDLNPGRTLQTLGPIFDNGTYDILFTYDYNLGPGQKTTATITLARNCAH
jgi:hypothetical protein